MPPKPSDKKARGPSGQKKAPPPEKKTPAAQAKAPTAQPKAPTKTARKRAAAPPEKEQPEKRRQTRSEPVKRQTSGLSSAHLSDLVYDVAPKTPLNTKRRKPKEMSGAKGTPAAG